MSFAMQNPCGPLCNALKHDKQEGAFQRINIEQIDKQLITYVWLHVHVIVHHDT